MNQLISLRCFLLVSTFVTLLSISSCSSSPKRDSTKTAAIAEQSNNDSSAEHSANRPTSVQLTNELLAGDFMKIHLKNRDEFHAAMKQLNSEEYFDYVKMKKQSNYAELLGRTNKLQATTLKFSESYDQIPKEYGKLVNHYGFSDSEKSDLVAGFNKSWKSESDTSIKTAMLTIDYSEELSLFVTFMNDTKKSWSVDDEGIGFDKEKDELRYDEHIEEIEAIEKKFGEL